MRVVTLLHVAYDNVPQQSFDNIANKMAEILNIAQGVLTHNVGFMTRQPKCGHRAVFDYRGAAYASTRLSRASVRLEKPRRGREQLAEKHRRHADA